jgi:hypothetical protein
MPSGSLAARKAAAALRQQQQQQQQQQQNAPPAVKQVCEHAQVYVSIAKLAFVAPLRFLSRFF